MILFGLVSFLGFVDAFYLTVKHFLGEIPSCAIFNDCGVVLQSQYSQVVGIPVALLGAVYYLALLLLTIWYLDRPTVWKQLLLARLTWLGLLSSVWFVFLMVVVLKAICPYCFVSAGTSAVLFIFGRVIERRLKDKTHI